MKKLLLVLIAVIGLQFAANAQEKAIGLRFGYGTEVSFQMPVGANRLEIDLGRLETLLNTYYHYFTGAFSYQWTFPISAVNGLGWYVGPCIGAGWYMSSYYTSGLTLGVGAIGGVDYKFAKIPLQLSVDFRPLYNVLNKSYYSNFDYSTALGVRYCF